MIKLRNRKYNTTQNVTPEKWERMKANGFESDYEVIDSGKPPVEVVEHIDAAAKAGKSEKVK